VLRKSKASANMRNRGNSNGKSFKNAGKRADNVAKHRKEFAAERRIDPASGWAGREMKPISEKTGVAPQAAVAAL
jgi:hypothetical protein